MNIKELLTKLPCSTNCKLRLYQNIRRLYWKYKYSKETYQILCEDQVLFPQNYAYGNEYWLKKYSNYSDYVYGVIEHGLFAKNNRTKVGWEVEWDGGSVLTYGDARYETLGDLYPDFNIVKVGPYIHYATMDESYYQELRSKIDLSSKSIILYPSHSLASKAYRYDVELFVKRALVFAKEYSIKNILVSLHPSDIKHGFHAEYNKLDSRIIPVTGGTDQRLFLPRVKAILSIADITYSNSVGTHIGYSLYMNKPHVVDSISDNLQDRVATTDYDLYHSQLFSKTFECRDPWIISKEQLELVDYYYGFGYVRSPEELYQELEKCKIIYTNRFNLR